jgi:hypothetical protein
MEIAGEAAPAAMDLSLKLDVVSCPSGIAFDG